MEPVTTTAITLALWEHAVKPVVKSIEKEYGDETKKLLKSGINKALQKFSLKKEEIELIEAEVIDTNKEILTDEKKFLKFFEKNKQISDVIIESNSRNKTIVNNVGKGVGYIKTMNGDMNFNDG